MPKVLIVDDETRLLQSIEAGLASYRDSFSAVTAIHGRQAIEILKSDSIDLLVTDLRMPVMDGFELLAFVSCAFPFMPTIVMTAFATPEIEELINATGTSRLLEKPIDVNRLAEAILEGLQQEGKEGAVAGFSLANFLQLLCLEKKTCLLHVHNDKSDGYLYLENGEIAAAITRSEKGEEAVFKLLTCDNAKITFKKIPQKKIARTIHKPLISLLMEAMCRIDETARIPLKDQPYTTELEPLDSLPHVSAQLASPAVLELKTEPAGIAPIATTTHEPSTQGEEIMSALDDTLGKLRDIDGFMAVGIFTPNGEMAAQVNTSGLKLAEIGSLANDVLLKAQKATDVMNVGRGQVVHIEAPKAHIIARCLNEAEVFSQNQAGKAHIHLVMMLDKDANLAMGKIKMESIIHQVAEYFR